MHFNDITYVFYSTGKKQLVLYTRTIYSYGPLDPQMDLSLPNDGTTLT